MTSETSHCPWRGFFPDVSKPGVFWVERVPKLTPQPHAGTHERSPTSAPWLFSTWCDKADAEPKGVWRGCGKGMVFRTQCGPPTRKKFWVVVQTPLGSQALGLFHVLMSLVEKGWVLLFQLHWLPMKLKAGRTKVWSTGIARGQDSTEFCRSFCEANAI